MSNWTSDKAVAWGLPGTVFVPHPTEGCFEAAASASSKFGARSARERHTSAYMPLNLGSSSAFSNTRMMIPRRMLSLSMLQIRVEGDGGVAWLVLGQAARGWGADLKWLLRAGTMHAPNVDQLLDQPILPLRCELVEDAA